MEALAGERFLPGEEGGKKMQRGPRKMFDVRHLGLTCADCGAPIEELPFMPKTDRPVYCQKCARNHRRQNPRFLR